MFDLLAQAGGGINIATVLAMVLGSSVVVALLDWVRNRRKDEATTRSIEDEVNKNLWTRAQDDLKRAYAKLDELSLALEQERQFRAILEGRVRDMEHRDAADRTQHYTALLEAIPDAVVQAGQYGLIKSANGAACRLFGYDAEEIVGQPITALMPARYKPAHRTAFAVAVETGKGALLESDMPARVHGLHADGHEFEVALRLSKQDKCFTAVIRPYLKRDGGELELLDYSEGAR